MTGRRAGARCFDPDKLERIAAELGRRYHANEANLRTLADSYGISYGTAHQMLREAGIPLKPHGGNRAGVEAARAAQAEMGRQRRARFADQWGPRFAAGKVSMSQLERITGHGYEFVRTALIEGGYHRPTKREM